MSEYAPYLLAAALAVVVGVSWAVWRMLPVWRGRASADLSPRDRAARWNRHLTPFLRRAMRGRAVVAEVRFEPGLDGREVTVATWCLARTILPDVELVALARPVAAADGRGVTAGESLGRVPAARLREVLGGDFPRQDLFGHLAYVYVWPDAADLNAVVALFEPAPPADPVVNPETP